MSHRPVDGFLLFAVSGLHAGPYDIVIMDMSFTRVLRAITECSPEEVQRLVFLGWPGQVGPTRRYLCLTR